MITVTMACGHSLNVMDIDVPVCKECGERRVASVKALAPKFRGVCQGPLATYEDLKGIPVTMGNNN